LVSRVGCDHSEKGGSSHAVGQHLVHVRMLEEAEAGATILGRKMGRPEARVLDLLLDRLPQRARVAALLIGRAIAPSGPKLVLVGQYLTVYDLRGEGTDLVDAGIERRDRLHVHLHGGLLCGLIT